MDFDVSQCPENSNSTDCLLRTLLQLLKEYREADTAAIDWDPINFAFTLLIGLIAILFALATIIQAISAAGKGRRRTSHLAIGKWSVEAEREWDWSDMNFRVTAITPILHEDSLCFSNTDSKNKKHATEKDGIRKAMQKAKLKFRASVKSIASCFHPNQGQSTESQPNQSRSPSAGWLEFFKEVGLDELDIDAWGTNTKKVVADYLPDDILAAPAYAQVGAIVAAAALAGIQKVDIDKQTSRNYPILYGQGFQIDFRQHPALGVVGAYSRYNETSQSDKTSQSNEISRTDETSQSDKTSQTDKTGKEFTRLKIEKLKSAMKTGRGFVDDRKMMDLSTESTRRQLIELWSQLGEAHAISCESWSATFALNSSAISEAHLPLIVGMFADRPRYVPALFPTATMRNHNCLAILALSGKYWAEVQLDKFEEPDISSPCKLQETPSWNGFIWPRGRHWESTMSSELQGFYHDLNIGEGVTSNPWVPDILEGYEAARAKLQAEREEQEEQEEAYEAQFQARVDEEIARLQAKREERGAAEKAQHEEIQAGVSVEIARLQADEDDRIAASRTQLEEETAVVEAAGARQEGIAEVRLPIAKMASGLHASVGELTVPQQETKAPAPTTVGHCLVLQTCLGLLHEPVLLEKWFSEASSGSLIFLRSLVREQLEIVDQWFGDKVSIRHRSILLCNTTIVLLRVEQMIGNNSSGPEESQCHRVQGGSIKQQQTQGRNRGRFEKGIASRTHLNLMQEVRNMVDGLDGLHGIVRDDSEMAKLLHDRSDPSLLRDRLKELVAYHSKHELDWQSWDQLKQEKWDNETRDIDDVIIYRCLMMVLLFRTAADSSKILESGIWDQVVPII